MGSLVECVELHYCWKLTFGAFQFFWPSADRAGELPKLVEDLLQTSISTGPRGPFRLAQGIQAVLGVGGEWLNDFSKVLSRFILLMLFL